MPRLEQPISDDVLTGDELTFEIKDKDVDRDSLKLLIDDKAVSSNHVEFTFDGDAEFVWAKNLSDDDWYAGSNAVLVWE